MLDGGCGDPPTEHWGSRRRPRIGDPLGEGTFQPSMTVSRFPEDVLFYFFWRERERLTKVKKESWATGTVVQSSKDQEEYVPGRDQSKTARVRCLRHGQVTQAGLLREGSSSYRAAMSRQPGRQEPELTSV